MNCCKRLQGALKSLNIPSNFGLPCVCDGRMDICGLSVVTARGSACASHAVPFVAAYAIFTFHCEICGPGAPFCPQSESARYLEAHLQDICRAHDVQHFADLAIQAPPSVVQDHRRYHILHFQWTVAERCINPFVLTIRKLSFT